MLKRYMANIWFHVVFPIWSGGCSLLCLVFHFISMCLLANLQLYACHSPSPSPFLRCGTLNLSFIPSVSAWIDGWMCVLVWYIHWMRQYSSNPSSTKTHKHTPTTESFQWSERNTCTIEEKHLVLVFLTMRTIFAIATWEMQSEGAKKMLTQNINLGHFAAIFFPFTNVTNINHPPGTQARVQNCANTSTHTERDASSTKIFHTFPPKTNSHSQLCSFNEHIIHKWACSISSGMKMGVAVFV